MLIAVTLVVVGSHNRSNYQLIPCSDWIIVSCCPRIASDQIEVVIAGDVTHKIGENSNYTFVDYCSRESLFGDKPTTFSHFVRLFQKLL